MTLHLREWEQPLSRINTSILSTFWYKLPLSFLICCFIANCASNTHLFCSQIRDLDSLKTVHLCSMCCHWDGSAGERRINFSDSLHTPPHPCACPWTFLKHNWDSRANVPVEKNQILSVSQSLGSVISLYSIVQYTQPYFLVGRVSEFVITFQCVICSISKPDK